MIMNNEFGAPVPVMLGGREYRFSPLTLEDIEELDNWVRAQYMRRVLGAIPKDADRADKELAMTIAQRTCVNLTWLSGQGAAMIASHAGAVKIAQLALAKRHPELTEDGLKGIMRSDPEAISSITQALQESAGSFTKRPAPSQQAAGHQPQPSP